MRYVAATVDRASAWRRLHRPRWWRRVIDRLRGRPRPTAEQARTGIPRLELLWLPHYLVCFDVRQDDKRRDDLFAMASAYDGATTLIDARGIGWETSEARERFCPTIDAEQAIAAARRVVMVARSRGPVWRMTKLDVSPGTAELIHYPFWAYYSEVGKGILDVALLDAWSGRPAGARVKTALLAALAAQRRASQA